MATSSAQLFLFGGNEAWSPLDWTSSDDRVRGGSSISHLNCKASSPIAIFNGNLDTKTLGGAGFASQRTTADKSWDLSKYDGLELTIDKSDSKQYTIIVKDEVLPKGSDGREQSTVSWEYDFTIKKAHAADKKVFVAWDDLKPTYRGREKKDTEPLDLKNIKRFSIMMRSFFGTQEGDFSISIVSIAASKNASTAMKPHRDDPSGESVPINLEDEKSVGKVRRSNAASGWLSWLCGRST